MDSNINAEQTEAEADAIYKQAVDLVKQRGHEWVLKRGWEIANSKSGQIELLCDLMALSVNCSSMITTAQIQQIPMPLNFTSINNPKTVSRIQLELAVFFHLVRQLPEFFKSS